MTSQKQKIPSVRFLKGFLGLRGPARRVTVGDALRHAYMEELHCPDDEPTREPLPCAPFEFERRKTGAEGLRAELWDEFLACHPDRSAAYYAQHPRQPVTSYRLRREGESVYPDDEHEAQRDEPGL